MAKNSSRDPIFTPELLKVLKIFGLASLFLVFALSFFNDKRADNTGEDRTFKVNDSNRLFFLNLRAIHYEREARADAKMTLFRHKGLLHEESKPSLNFVIILNALKDESYIYFEPQNIDWPIDLKAVSSEGEKLFHLENGNNMLFYSYLNELSPWIEVDAGFYIQVDGNWERIWETEEERESLKEIIEDYIQLLENK
ncbi:hypothetical protein FHS59_002132 [Algoriphagus iocasae]|jgi:hypothetical protein|uniref:Uncharacterized protein n=1 Tax=Algoriphagus iocasae TaxID=1836499 RepID=A0A841MP23_9BACT|nr:hypothetical protein [Algoriphagus iocasae]MBB6326504.1 hypothetical protein [Algoriphagus iocasae]